MITDYKWILLYLSVWSKNSWYMIAQNWRIIQKTRSIIDLINEDQRMIQPMKVASSTYFVVSGICMPSIY